VLGSLAHDLRERPVLLLGDHSEARCSEAGRWIRIRLLLAQNTALIIFASS
jgi:hypothetical protein